MAEFSRIGDTPFHEDGRTRDICIKFDNASKLQIMEGGIPTGFELKFSKYDNSGWWVTPKSLDQLIAELLYIRQDIKNLTEVDVEEVEYPVEVEAFDPAAVVGPRGQEAVHFFQDEI